MEMQQSRMNVGMEKRESSSSARASQSHGSPLRPLPLENTAPSPTDTSRSFAFPPITSSPRQGPAQRASLVIRQRRSSPLLHEIQGPSRRLSAHQMLLLTPFGGALPEVVAAPSGRMARGSSSMGGPHSGRSASFGMSSIPSSTGMGRDDPSTARGLPTLSSRFNARHQSLIQPVNPSPLSQPMSTIQSASDYGSESDSSSLGISRDHSDSNSSQSAEEEDDGGAMERIEAARRANAAAVAMMRSNSLPVLTQRELDAMQDKDGELGISRGAHWAWVQDDADDVQIDSPVPNTTPPSRPFAFQDPFASALGTSQNSQSISPRYTAPTTTSSNYHYSPTAEPRRMSEVNPTWPHHTSPGSQTVTQSRGTSIATITLSTSPSSPSNEDNSPPLPAFNSRASLSALEHNPFLPVSATENLAPVRPRILRYKTSPARFTGLGLHLVVKSQPTSSGTSKSGSGSGSGPPTSRRRSSGIGIDIDRRRSSGASTSSNEGRRGTWAVVDVVDKLSSAIPSITTSSTTTTTYPSASSIQSLRNESNRSSMPMPNPIYTVEHISARSGSLAMTGSDRFKSLPSRKGKPSPFAYDSISPGGLFNDPLAFPRRGSLAVLSQTALGPWASPSVPEVTEELLGAPKGNWQDRRGSWAEGWSNTAR